MKWINVNDALPPAGKEVLVSVISRASYYNYYYLAKFSLFEGGYWDLHDGGILNIKNLNYPKVTHWCAIVPPEDQE